MTDIYVSPQRSKRGCFLFSFLGILLIAGGIVLFRSCRVEAPGSRDPLPQQPTPAASPDASLWPERLQEAEKLIADGRLQQARTLLQDCHLAAPPPLVRQQLETLLGEVQSQLLLTPAPMREKVDHVIQRGDTLGKLAHEHGTTVELIQTSNQIQGNLIRVGDRIRIFSGGRFRVHVDKSDNLLEVFLNDQFFKRYKVGTGKYNRTPVGRYRITLRQRHPVWYRPDGIEVPYGDPENLLGTHYLKLDTPGIGLHGTWEDDTIGSQSSAGCVRLLNADIEELYTILPEGTEVEIID